MPPPAPGQTGGLLRSADMVISWDALEVSEGLFDWSQLKTAVANARGSGGVLTVLFWTGIWGPNWMYTANKTSSRPAVPAIASQGGSTKCTKPQSCCPDYASATYQSLLRDRHIALANELRSMDALGTPLLQCRTTAVLEWSGSSTVVAEQQHYHHHHHHHHQQQQHHQQQHQQ
jgi:hypothetical protein